MSSRYYPGTRMCVGQEHPVPSPPFRDRFSEKAFQVRSPRGDIKRLENITVPMTIVRSIDGSTSSSVWGYHPLSYIVQQCITLYR